ncbi:helix-hairpin-helix domain-containing protein [Shewanella sp. AS16]|nr:helix-hairpin-helix domain-containing protein [Shewanella sp. AS16]MCE9685605.1 helix-hairpin-helix domain-containing protein [Shewanella sp. AS16]
MPRDEITQFQQIPNVGKATEQDFLRLGFKTPAELAGKDPYQMYQDLCRVTGQRHDPCVIDVFIAAVRYMEGGPARKWWEFTAERKRHLQE